MENPLKKNHLFIITYEKKIILRFFIVAQKRGIDFAFFTKTAFHFKKSANCKKNKIAVDFAGRDRIKSIL